MEHVSDPILVFEHVNGGNDYILCHVQNPKICKECKHFTCEENNKYKKCLRLVGKTHINLRTGELDVIDEIAAMPCYIERHTFNPEHCGVNGKYWEPR